MTEWRSTLSHRAEWISELELPYLERPTKLTLTLLSACRNACSSHLVASPEGPWRVASTGRANEATCHWAPSLPLGFAMQDKFTTTNAVNMIFRPFDL